MADLNTAYVGVSDTIDPDFFYNALLKLGYPFNGTADAYRATDEYKQRRAELVKHNADVQQTIADVKTAYTGKTTADRIAWLQARIKAVNNRVAFIKARTDQIIQTLKDNNSQFAETAFNTISAGLSLIPIGGQIWQAFVVNDKKQREATELAQAQQLIQAYSDDLNQLATIRGTLQKELSQYSTSDLINNAPTVSNWLFIALAGLILLLIIWYRKRKKKRSKR